MDFETYKREQDIADQCRTDLHATARVFIGCVSVSAVMHLASVPYTAGGMFATMGVAMAVHVYSGVRALYRARAALEQCNSRGFEHSRPKGATWPGVHVSTLDGTAGDDYAATLRATKKKDYV